VGEENPTDVAMIKDMKKKLDIIEGYFIFFIKLPTMKLLVFTGTKALA